ncbi:hypothetical protein SAMN04489860_0764 [Paraoerskovia marina]|uniref:DUF4870 domain-containing protein n=1 Tax=Paraoerskovia marina TaxID=545619 RepID=A0A1H1PBQ8_9CELL|nr:DUF4870 domain-containing protein [Paraoerskovia marina]SDS08681.1 hypothetical protein SAMN04489860_0764 [Paraoerskovia marina]
MSQTPPPPPPASAPQPLSDSDTRQWAGLSHLLGGILGFLAPLVIWLVFRERSAYVAEESKKALNFQLLALIVYVVAAVLPLGFLGTLVTFGVWVVSVVFGIINYQKVQRAEATEYPVTVSWVR